MTIQARLEHGGHVLLVEIEEDAIALTFWVITTNTRDFGEIFTVRRIVILKHDSLMVAETEPLGAANTVEAARAVESWL